MTASRTPPPTACPVLEPAAEPRRRHQRPAAGGTGLAVGLAFLADGAGVAALAVADAQSRSGAPYGYPLFWGGLALILVPSAWVLLLSRQGRAARLAVALGFGLSLYLAKVAYEPTMFTFHDEFAHYRNASNLLASGQLFGYNPLIRATGYYPGLAVATDAIAHLTGLPVYASGLILIGCARLTLVGALFLLTDELLRSPRAAGTAVVAYAANPNFLYFDAQYGYESLALPLAVLAVYFLARRGDKKPTAATMAAGLATALAVVATHHITAWFLAVILLAWAGAAWLRRRPQQPRPSWLRRHPERSRPSWLRRHPERPQPGWRHHRPARARPAWLRLPSGGGVAEGAAEGAAEGTADEATASAPAPEFLPVLPAAVTAGAALTWVLAVAPITVAYIGPVLARAVQQGWQLIIEHRISRALFANTGQAVAAPRWEDVAAIAATLVILAIIPVALLRIRRARLPVVAKLLATTSLAWVALLPLRFTAAGQETANRSSEFAYLGIALCFAFLVESLPSSARWRPLLALGAVVLMFTGGVAVSWNYAQRLAPDYQLANGSVTVTPDDRALAQWMLVTLGPGHRIATDAQTGLALGSLGRQDILTWAEDGAQVWLIFYPRTVTSGVQAEIRRSQVQYVVVQGDVLDLPEGVTRFDPSEPEQYDESPLPAASLAKFGDSPLFREVYTVGSLKVYQVSSGEGL
jgi:hypothetical protein